MRRQPGLHSATLLVFLLASSLCAPAQDVSSQQLMDAAREVQSEYILLIQTVGHSFSQAMAEGNAGLAERLNQLNALLLRVNASLDQTSKSPLPKLDQKVLAIRELRRMGGEITKALQASDASSTLDASRFQMGILQALAKLPSRPPANTGGDLPLIVGTPSMVSVPKTFTPPQAAPPTTPSGKWTGSMETHGNRVPIYLTLDNFQRACQGAQCAQTFSGTVATNDETKQVAIEKAEIHDNELSFEVHDNANRLVKFRLIQAGGGLRGEAISGDETSLVTFGLGPNVFGSGAYRVGGGVSAPVVLQKVDPEYSEEARAAKAQGTVLLSVVIDASGDAKNIKVVRSLGLGLDEKAIEAVKQWRFRPGAKDGKPVSVMATIEVNFRL